MTQSYIILLKRQNLISILFSFFWKISNILLFLAINRQIVCFRNIIYVILQRLSKLIDLQYNQPLALLNKPNGKTH